MVHYTEVEVIDFVTKDVENFTSLKEYHDYCKNWKVNTYGCWMPEFCQTKINSIIISKTKNILNKYNLLFTNHKINIFNGLQEFIIKTDYEETIPEETIHNIIKDIDLEIEYTLIKHDFDKYYEHKFLVINEEEKEGRDKC